MSLNPNSEISLLTALKNSLVSFLDELIEVFPDQPDFVIFRIFVRDQIPIAKIMEYITKNLCPMMDMVKERNEKFFIDHNVLFEEFSDAQASKVNHFKQIWTSNKIDKETKETIWRWFYSFIVIGNKYLELQKNK